MSAGIIFLAKKYSSLLRSFYEQLLLLILHQQILFISEKPSKNESYIILYVLV